MQANGSISKGAKDLENHYQAIEKKTGLSREYFKPAKQLKEKIPGREFFRIENDDFFIAGDFHAGALVDYIKVRADAKAIASLKPTVVILNGDFSSNLESTNFVYDIEYARPLNYDLDCANATIGIYAAACAEIGAILILISGNHDLFPINKINRKVPELAGMRTEEEELDHLLQLEKIRTLYQIEIYVVKELDLTPNLIVHHGHRQKANQSQVLAAAHANQHGNQGVIQSHTHRLGVGYVTVNDKGRPVDLIVAETGMSQRRESEYGDNRALNWAQGSLYVTVREGQAQTEILKYCDQTGCLRFRNQRWDLSRYLKRGAQPAPRAIVKKWGGLGYPEIKPGFYHAGARIK